MEKRTRTDHERKFRQYEMECERLRLVNKSHEERSYKFRKNLRTFLRNTGIVVLICGSVIYTFQNSYIHFRIIENLTPEQRRDSYVMMQNKDTMSAYETQVGDAIHWKDFGRARKIYEHIKNRLCPSESEIGKECKERYQENIFSLNRNEMRDFH